MGRDLHLESYNKKMPLKLEDKIYNVVVRPSMVYDVEYWPVKNSHIQN